MHSLYEILSGALTAVGQGNMVALLVMFLVATLTEVGIPFPFIIDGALFTIGFRAGLVSIHILLVMLALFLGRVVGSAIIYWVSRLLQQPVLDWLSKRFPSIRTQIGKLCARLGTKAPVAVALARLTPGLLTPASIAAGTIKMRVDYFIFGVALSSIVADGLLVLIGFLAGHGMHSLGVTESVWVIVVGFLAAVALIWFVRRFLFRPDA